MYVDEGPGGVGQGAIEATDPAQCTGSTGSSGAVVEAAALADAVEAVPDDVEVPTWALPPVEAEGGLGLPAEAQPAQAMNATAVAVPNAQVLTSL